ncbi:MAG TPA: tetratricopeptide repeat protein [Leptolyngbyaceae cyanobacterium]
MPIAATSYCVKTGAILRHGIGLCKSQVNFLGSEKEAVLILSIKFVGAFRTLFQLGASGLVLLVGLTGCRSKPPATVLASAAPSQTVQMALTYPAFLIDVKAAERYRQAGLRYRQSGNFEGAIAALKIAAALDPLNPNSYVILGWTQHLAGNRSAAAQTLETALDQTSENVPALNALGIVYLVEGDLQAAIATHNRAAELKPNNEIAHYNLSLAHQRLGQLEQAQTHAELATQLEPNNPHPWVALALVHWSKEEQPQAQKLYQQVVEMDGRYQYADFLPKLAKAGFSPEQIQMTEAVRSASLQGWR